MAYTPDDFADKPTRSVSIQRLTDLWTGLDTDWTIHGLVTSVLL